MKTIEGFYEKGRIRLKRDIELPEAFPVYVLVPDEERRVGINPDRNRRIQEAKREARKRIRAERAVKRPASSRG